MSEAASSPGRSSYRRYVLGVLLVISVFNFIDRQLLAVLSPEIKKELLLSDTQLGILKGLAFALFYSVLGIPLARVADRFHRVNLISASIVVWSAMTSLSGAASGFLHLLLARIGVGVGEAGATPASHSILSDYFARSERATAIAILSLGIPIGTTFGFLAGGWLTAEVGWRMAFVLIGLPGVAVGILTKLTVREPVRGARDSAQAIAAAPPSASWTDTLATLWGIPSYRTIAISGGFSALCGYALSMWLVDFLVRVHGLTYQEILLELALSVGVGGGLGTYFGGKLADRLGRKNVTAYLTVPGLGMVLVAPLLLLALWTNSETIIFIALFFVFALHYSCFGPFYGTVQTLAPIRARAIATAFLFFIMALGGAGMGPFVTGVISDLFEPAYGSAKALQLAMSSITFISLGAGLFAVSRARYLVADLEAARPAELGPSEAPAPAPAE
jgi:predicted MFS family arabinose efflux permease